MMFAMAAVLTGALFGLRFKVTILFPATAAGSIAALGTGLAQGNGPWSILFSIVMTIAMLQAGYFAGAILASAVARTWLPEPVAATQKSAR